MWLKKCTCFLLACVAVFGCLFTPVAAAELGEQKVEINKKIMFSFQVSSLEKDQSLCRELIKSRGKTISLLLNEIPFIVTIDTCSFSKTSDDMYFRDFNIIVLNQFFVYSN